MHNLHLIRVKADTPEKACSRVELDINDFGNENNWRTICGCLSSTNEPYDSEGGRWSPSTDGYNTIEALNETVKGWIEADSYKADLIDNINDGKVKLKDLSDRMDIYAVKKYLEHKGMVMDVGLKENEEFDILKHTFYDYQYTECGVTECYGDGENTYIVFVDMHD
jgi:hypothetical protein